MPHAYKLPLFGAASRWLGVRLRRCRTILGVTAPGGSIVRRPREPVEIVRPSWRAITHMRNPDRGIRTYQAPMVAAQDHFFKGSYSVIC
jgi:hypothetical protein